MDQASTGQSMYKVGQKVTIKEYGPAIVISEDSSGSTYIVAQKNKRGKIYTWTVEISEIEPYINVCWKCGRTVDSSKDRTCSICHWVICPEPECQVCGKPTCTSDGIPSDIEYPIIENKPMKIDERAANAEFYGRFYQGF